MRALLIDFFCRSIILTILVVGGFFSAYAQLHTLPLEKKGKHHTPFQSQARTKATILELPFWDDFSNPNGEPARFYPDTLLWQNSHRVWVNEGMGINEPTKNVATFDGLDSLGLAYSKQQVLLTGYNDELTSHPIDLSENNISIAGRDSVYLSFFYQWQGNGEPPDSEDYLQLEFKTKQTTADSSEWVPVLKIFHKTTFDPTVFYDTIIKLDTGYFHEAFQFRFRNFGRQSGPFDTWNIDYVYLNKNRTIDDLSFPDRAIASGLSPLFGLYTSIPYRHFIHTKQFDTVQFDVKNLSAHPSDVSYSMDGKLTNYFPDSTQTVFEKNYIQNKEIRINELGQPSNFMNAFERVRADIFYDSLPDANDPQQFNPSAIGVDIDLKVRIASDDPADSAKYRPINFFVNDTVSASYHLRDYYAYDDGIAEYSAGLIQPGNMLLYQFDMLLSDELPADTLAGIRYYFPPHAVSPNQTVTFFVYHDDNGKPGELWQTYSPRAIQQTGTNEFQELTFIPALLINEPRFYIGWRQPVEGKALIGLDINNDTGDRIFINVTGSEWELNNAVRGSLMLRPFFGHGTLEGDYNVRIEDDLSLSVFPNPSDGSFYIEGDYDQLTIYNSTGNEISFTSERSKGRSQIRLNSPSGLYLMRIARGNLIKTHKIVISR